MHTIFRFLLFFFILISQMSMAQSSKYPADYFRPPLDIPMYLSGTFGELRSNHFHAGIDIKTQGVEGKAVYAIADGYVSRIKISRGGYGKALYVTHPNGFVSVYGHLKHFNDSIQRYIVAEQYKNKSFEIQRYPDKGVLMVKKGQLIAFSGNTGGSQGPHLHFEIREEKSQFPVNPLFFKSIKVKDYFRPKITRLAIYPVDENAFINGQQDTVFYTVEGWGLEHRLKGDPKIAVSGNISFGLSTFDLMNDIPNKNGIYDLSLSIDSSKVFGLRMDRLSFNTTRYINSLIDYGYYQQKRNRLIRTQIDTNNRLFNYRGVLNNGIVRFDDSLQHQAVFTVEDVYGNISSLAFELQSHPLDSGFIKKNLLSYSDAHFFHYSNKNHFVAEGIEAHFPANAFYQSFVLTYSRDSMSKTTYSPIHSLGNPFIPIHKSYNLSLVADGIDEKLKPKMYIAYINDKGESGYLGGKWDANKITVSARLFGSFALMADSLKPEIKAVNFSKGKAVGSTIKVRIKDEQSGIKTYNGYLNGDWILMEYDAKKNLLFYTLDAHMKKGKNSFKLVVVDALGNESVFERELIR